MANQGHRQLHATPFGGVRRGQNYPIYADALTLKRKRLESFYNRWIVQRTLDNKTYAVLISGTSSKEELEDIINPKVKLSEEAKNAFR